MNGTTLKQYMQVNEMSTLLQLPSTASPYLLELDNVRVHKAPVVEYLALHILCHLWQ